MSTVINTNTVATRTTSIYNRNNALMNGALTRLATQQRIDSAKDNASVYAISERMRERIRANDQANQNSQNDAALLKTAQGGLANTLDILNTLKERAINSANDSNVNLDRSAIVTEVQSLVAQIDQNANSVKFNGRTLLNGAVDSSATATASKTSTTEAAAAKTVTASNVGTITPNVVNVTGNTNADWGTNSVFAWTNLKTAANTFLAADNKKLVGEIKDASGSNNLFSNGDRITFSYKVDGEEKNFSYEITSDTKVADLMTAVKNSDKSGISDFKYLAEDTAIGSVKDADDVAIKTSAAGLYLIGASDKSITDLQVAVTKTENNKQVTQLTAQNELEATGLVRYHGDTAKGTNSVYDFGTNTITGNNGDNTRLMDLESSTNKLIVNGEADDTITFNVNGKEVSVSGESTIADLNEAFANNGINVRAHLYSDTTTTVQYDGQTVTKGTKGGAIDLKSTATLTFVTAEGTALNELTVTAKAADGTNRSFLAAVAATDTNNEKIQLNDLTRTLALDTDRYTDATTSSSSTAVTPSLLPQGSNLTFYVGGESNFGINFAIGKATAQNLLGNVDSFANMFAKSDTAQEAISVIDNAITKTLNEQTRLGSMEARMGYISDNLSTMNENLEASDSVMRDTDMAKEMTSYMKFMVLSQASQYMLSQASQNAFQVLNLLQP